MAVLADYLAALDLPDDICDLEAPFRRLRDASIAASPRPEMLAARIKRVPKDKRNINMWSQLLASEMFAEAGVSDAKMALPCTEMKQLGVCRRLGSIIP